MGIVDVARRAATATGVLTGSVARVPPAAAALREVLPQIFFACAT